MVNIMPLGIFSNYLRPCSRGKGKIRCNDYSEIGNQIVFYNNTQFQGKTRFSFPLIKLRFKIHSLLKKTKSVGESENRKKTTTIIIFVLIMMVTLSTSGKKEKILIMD